MINKLTLSKETDPQGGEYFFIRLDNGVVKVFDLDKEEEARAFFDKYTQAPVPVILCERFLDTPAPGHKSSKIFLGNIVMEYRGVTITDQPYGNTPFTFIHDGEIVPHADTRGLEDALTTIDELLDGVVDAEDSPSWQVNLDRLKKWDKDVQAFSALHSKQEPKEDDYESDEEYRLAAGVHRDKFMAGFPTPPMLIGQPIN